MNASHLDGLQAAAMQADDEFQHECVRQFGETNASSCRYMSNQHDERTAAARTKFQNAQRRYGEALAHARKNIRDMSAQLRAARS